MLNKANITWSAKQIKKMIDNGKITFDNAVQRGLVWDKNRKSLLIHSMLVGYPIPPCYATKRDGIYEMLDAKQRLSSIREFIDDEFFLVNIPEVDGEDINDLKFSELSEDMQDEILSYSFTIYYFDGITDEEIGEMFFRLNNGKPVSAIEQAKAKAKSLEVIRRIGQHEFFGKTMSQAQLDKFAPDEMVIKLLIMLSENEPEVSSKHVREVIENTEITENMEKMLSNKLTDIMTIWEYATNAKKTQKAIAKKVNILTIAGYMADNAYDVRELSDMCFEFFPDCTEEYLNLCKSGTDKKANIAKRIEIFKDFVEKEED